MPHDKNGTRINIGDIVTIRARIRAIHDTEDYCNLDLEALERMPPLNSVTSLTLNAKQVALYDGYDRLPTIGGHEQSEPVVEATENHPAIHRDGHRLVVKAKETP